MSNTSYTIQTGDVLLCDINATKTTGSVGATVTVYNTGTLSATSGLCFNFHPGESVTKQLDKTIYVVRKPGIPTMYEIGLGERIFNITTTIKAPTATYASGIFKSLQHLNWLCNDQYNTVITGGKKSYGILNFYYYGDGVQSTFYRVGVKSLWYEQRSGKGTMFDIRISLTEVEVPG